MLRTGQIACDKLNNELDRSVDHGVVFTRREPGNRPQTICRSPADRHGSQGSHVAAQLVHGHAAAIALDAATNNLPRRRSDFPSQCGDEGLRPAATQNVKWEHACLA
jgi:hypothetical protein